MASPPWTNTWDETKPADTDLANTLGVQGRQVKLDVRQRLDWQHVWNVDVNHDGGHRFVAIESAYHPANTSSFASAGFSLTVANAQSIVDLAGTWNTSGTPTGIKLNITDTLSNAASLLMDLQVGGVSKFSVSKAGVVLANGAAIVGGLVQTVQGSSSTNYALTGSYADVTSLAVTITPTSVANRVRIQASVQIYLVATTGGSCAADLRVTRNGSTVGTFPTVSSSFNSASDNQGGTVTVAIDCIDSPASVAALTYKIQAKYNSGLTAPFTGQVNTAFTGGNGVSTITASEII